MQKVGIVCCSNGQRQANEKDIKILEKQLWQIGLEPMYSEYIYAKDGIFCGSAKERAQALMKFYEDDEITEIFDISGGDLANGILPYLEYEKIAATKKRFWGYSDLTTVINAIYAKTGKASVLYQVRNLIYHQKEKQVADFTNTMMEDGTDLYAIEYQFVQGNAMQGIVVGGNIRCFLKLAGTEYMPDLKDKILLLESYSGTAAKMETYLCQLQQMGAFEKVAGILLGTFTEMEEKECVPRIETLVQKIAGDRIPIVVTKDIGHGTDAKAVRIGKKYSF